MVRIIVVQVGARHNYRIPFVLEQVGMLERLYTDLCAEAGLGKWLNQYWPKPLRTKSITRLTNRKIPSNLKFKLSTCDGAAVKFEIRKYLSSSNLIQKQASLVRFNQEFGNAIKKKAWVKQHIYMQCLEKEVHCSSTLVKKV